MRTLDASHSGADITCIDRADGEIIDQKACSHHISHRIHRPDLVKVYVLDRLTVHSAFSLNDKLEHRKRIRLYVFRNTERAYDAFDIGKIRMVMMGVVFMAVMVMMVVPVVRTMVRAIVRTVMLVVLALITMMMSIASTSLFLLALYFTIDLNTHVKAGNSTFIAALKHVFHARDPKCIEPLTDRLRIIVEPKQRSGDHIASRTHVQIEVKNPHLAHLI